MKILVACEESQVVTKLFRTNGHEAYSCDVITTSGDNPEWHLQQDVTPLLEEKWDMIIAFPPCTRLCVSGARWWKDRRQEHKEAINFFMLFANNSCEKIAIENPVGIMSTRWRKPDQIIHPYQFGDDSTKSTCLWLKGLPLLKPTNIIKPTKHVTKTGKVYDKWWFDTCLITDLKKRSVIRSKTFLGIAEAMAEQWG